MSHSEGGFPLNRLNIFEHLHLPHTRVEHAFDFAFCESSINSSLVLKGRVAEVLKSGKKCQEVLFLATFSAAECFAAPF